MTLQNRVDPWGRLYVSRRGARRRRHSLRCQQRLRERLESSRARGDGGGVVVAVPRPRRPRSWCSCGASAWPPLSSAPAILLGRRDSALAGGMPLANPRLTDIRGACVFDAYAHTVRLRGGRAAVRGHGTGQHTSALTALWRDKQLQYTWLRTAQGKHADSPEAHRGCVSHLPTLETLARLGACNCWVRLTRLIPDA